MSTFFKRNNKGFTLIELLVVIAIIGVLATVILASLNNARRRSRDARRVSDLREIKLAAELFFDNNGTYPTAGNLANLQTQMFISQIPVDPLDQDAYPYDPFTSAGVQACAAACSSYHLGATLVEPANRALLADADILAAASTFSGTAVGPEGTPCQDVDGVARTAAAAMGETEFCYDIRP